MKPSTLALLCNPYKGEPFKFSGNNLEGLSSKEIYPIINGIPNIIDRSYLTPRDKLYQWFYNISAPFYDLVMKIGGESKINDERIVREEYISEININDGDRVLEVSIGTGLNTPYIKADTEYFGVDISQRMLEKAQYNLDKWGKEAELFLANGAYLPFRDDVFDVVFQMGGLQFYGNPFRGVSEMARVAKPGSKIYILDEQTGAVRTLNRLPAHKKYASNVTTASKAMTRLVPMSMNNISSAPLPYGKYYTLEFQKPPFQIPE